MKNIQPTQSKLQQKPKQIAKLALGLLLSLSLILISASQVQAEWTNVCGSGTNADWTGRAGQCSGCDRNSKSCSGNYVYKFVCHGRTTECGNVDGGGTPPFAAYGPSAYQSISNEQCDTTIQIDVFGQSNYGDLQDYMVWYTGPCDTPPPTQTPTPVPTATPTPSPSPTLTPTTTPTYTPTPTMPTNTPTPGPSATPSPTTTATPSPTTTATPSPTQPAHQSSCDSLRVLSGDGALVPATVKFEAKGSDSGDGIQEYRFYFGDGEELKTDDNVVEHEYQVSGEFDVRVEVKDSVGNWKTSDECTTTVNIESSPVETHKSACSNVFITAGNGAYAPSRVNFTVTGYDNKGDLQGYRLNYGTGHEDTHLNDDNTFSRVYDTPGTYTIRAYIKDSKGNWKGGDEGCKETLYIKTEPLDYQPDTGTPTILSLGSIIAGAAGMTLRSLKKKLLA
jgi:hypothetical protein